MAATRSFRIAGPVAATTAVIAGTFAMPVSYPVLPSMTTARLPVRPCKSLAMYLANLCVRNASGIAPGVRRKARRNRNRNEETP